MAELSHFLQQNSIPHIFYHINIYYVYIYGLPRWLSGKESGCQCKSMDWSVLLVVAILTGVRWYLTVSLTFFSLMIAVVELLMHLMSFRVPSLEKCLFHSSAHFPWNYLFPWYWVTWVPYAFCILTLYLIYPGGSDHNESTCNAGDPGLMPGLGRSPGEGNGNPRQYTCLENAMDRGSWWVTVHRVAESWTQLRS